MKILLIVTGSISAYKAADVASRLISKGNEVRVLMTEDATKFIQPLTFSAITHQDVLLDKDWFRHDLNGKIFHIHDVEKADKVVLCPATANTIAKLAHGIADNLASSSLLAALGMNKPIYVFPAMNSNMLTAKTTERNLSELAKFENVKICETGFGNLACGAVGKGKLLEVNKIIEIIS